MNGGCRFALQARVKLIDQVRILAKTRILWNHGRVLLCPGSREILYATFVLNWNLPWELHGPTLVLLLEAWSALGLYSLVCWISLLEQ